MHLPVFYSCAREMWRNAALYFGQNDKKIEKTIDNSEEGVYNRIDILAKYTESLLLQSDGGGAIRKTLATVPRKGILQ